MLRKLDIFLHVALVFSDTGHVCMRTEWNLQHHRLRTPRSPCMQPHACCFANGRLPHADTCTPNEFPHVCTRRCVHAQTPRPSCSLQATDWSNLRKRSRIWAHAARPEYALQFECRGDDRAAKPKVGSPRKQPAKMEFAIMAWQLSFEFQWNKFRLEKKKKEFLNKTYKVRMNYALIKMLSQQRACCIIQNIIFE